MKNFFLNFEMNAETCNKFMIDLQEFENGLNESILKNGTQEQDKGPVANIYVGSPGGHYSEGANLYHFFKNSKFEYNFILSGFCDSCSFLFIIALCPKNVIVYKSASSVVHEISITVDSRDLNKKSNVFMKRISDLNETNDTLLEFVRNALPAEDFVEYERDREISLSGGELNEVIKKVSQSDKLKDLAKRFFEINLES